VYTQSSYSQKPAVDAHTNPGLSIAAPMVSPLTLKEAKHHSFPALLILCWTAFPQGPVFLFCTGPTRCIWKKNNDRPRKKKPPSSTSCFSIKIHMTCRDLYVKEYFSDISHSHKCQKKPSLCRVVFSLMQNLSSQSFRTGITGNIQ